MYHKLPLPLVYFSWKPQFFYFCRGTVARMQNFNVQKIASLAPIAHFFTFLLERLAWVRPWAVWGADGETGCEAARLS